MRRLDPRATKDAALKVHVGDATSCSPVGITWDASKGTAPWTVMIAPINQTPITLSISDASGSAATYNWSVPYFTKQTDTFIAVSDSTGQVSGVASKVSIGTSGTTCDPPDQSLDFVWFPTQDASLPAECSDWGITYDTEDGNNGIKGKVTFTFLPEKGVPITVSTSSGKTTSKGGSFNFNVPWDSGTKFAAIANDGGQAGTGGVGDLYSVTAGKSTACSSTNSIGNGLPAAQTTVSIKDTSGTKSSSSSSTASNSNSGSDKGSASSNVPQFTQGSTAADGSSTSSHSSVGAAVGGTFAALAAIALLLGLLWYYRKRRADKADNPFEKEADHQHGISPWRWSSSPYEAPVTNSRASKWLDKAASIAPTKGFRVLGDRGSDRGNHGVSNSVSTSFKGPFTTTTHARKTSSLSSPISPPQQHATSFRNVVPDAALFPPPKPMFNDERGYNHKPLPYTEGASAPPYSGQHAGVGTYDSMTKDSASQYSTSPQDAAFTLQKASYHPMPNQPVGHLWQDQQHTPTHEVQPGNMHMQPHVTNEVMMQDMLRRDQKRQSQHSEEGLPYL